MLGEDRRCVAGALGIDCEGSLMKKLLVLLAALGAGAFVVVKKRRDQAAAEAALWDEATRA